MIVNNCKKVLIYEIDDVDGWHKQRETMLGKILGSEEGIQTIMSDTQTVTKEML
jgi:hypothetical protein